MKIANFSIFQHLGLPVLDMTVATDSRLPRYALLGQAEAAMVLPSEYADLGDDGDERPTLRQFLDDAGWELRPWMGDKAVGCLLVDDEFACVARESKPPGQGLEIAFLDGAKETQPYQRYFDHLWEASAEILWDELLPTSFKQAQIQLAGISEGYWQALIRHFAEHPDEMQQMHPRKFEELVQQLLHREGLTTQLTPERKDGGFDLMALADTSLGQHLYLIECKRHNISNPVGVEIVRALYGLVEQHKATAGVIVTTSRFTKGALAFQREIKSRLALHDYEVLKNWLRRHGS